MTRTPAELHTAITFKNFLSVSQIVESGTNMDKLWRGNTAISCAVYKRAYGILDYLVRKGANVNIRTRDDRMEPPLFAACRLGQLEAIKILLKSTNVDVNQRDFFNHTPLWAAARINSYEIVELLLNNGADICAAQRLVECPLIVALIRRYTSVAHLLIRRGYRVDIDFDSAELHRKPLYITVQHADLETFVLLINAGCQIKKAEWLSPNQLPHDWKNDKKLCKWIDTLQNTPRTLLTLTSCSIRQILVKCHKNIFSEHVGELPIPKELIKLILLV
ncbi:ankyrin repeat-containing protein DDB_G0279043-like [Parasteatoda tepidariorum]|uniref:ankyrin repeat-containing protein DDB_G0279043-like n=1 Tax=Parasteatoda tepidariorum TaxID=114398 RepID=UPI0039BD164B